MKAGDENHGRAGADVCDPVRRQQLRHLEPGQAVRYVDVDRGRRFGHGRMRIRLGPKSLQEALHPLREVALEPVARPQCLERFTWNAHRRFVSRGTDAA